MQNEENQIQINRFNPFFESQGLLKNDIYSMEEN
jgi:hypothetical protein